MSDRACFMRFMSLMITFRSYFDPISVMVVKLEETFQIPFWHEARTPIGTTSKEVPQERLWNENRIYYNLAEPNVLRYAHKIS